MKNHINGHPVQKSYFGQINFSHNLIIITIYYVIHLKTLRRIRIGETNKLRSF